MTSSITHPILLRRNREPVTWVCEACAMVNLPGPECFWCGEDRNDEHEPNFFLRHVPAQVEDEQDTNVQ